MASLARRGSDVRIKEVDLSQTLAQNSNATLATVAVSAKGPVGPTFYSDPNVFIEDFGLADARVSFDHYAILDYFKEGNSCWVTRVLGAGAKYSGIALLVDDSGNTILRPIAAGLNDPYTFIDTSSYVLSGDTLLATFWPRQGPGSYANSLAVSLSTPNLVAPTNLNAIADPAGGTMAAGTYEYMVSALSSHGESLASIPATVVIGGVGTSYSVELTWDKVEGAIGYCIYGRQGPTLVLLAKIGVSTAAFIDDGRAPLNLDQHPITNVLNLVDPSYNFRLKIYDMEQSTTVPVEQFDCCLVDAVDETGAQMELSQRLNMYSKYLHVQNDTYQVLGDLPRLESISSPTRLDGGSSGAAPTSANINNAYNKYQDKQRYVIDVITGNGRTDPAINFNTDHLAVSRFDCVSFIDVPPGSQTTAQRAVDYRNMTMNLNSSFSALFCSDLLESDPNSGKLLYIPPSGAMAGLMARTVRVGQPWYSIAGLNRGLLGVIDVRSTYDDGASTLLYNAQVNYTRKFIGQGIALWEQSTMYAAASALQFLNVRVLCNVIKRSMYGYLLYSLQEQNDDILRKQIKHALEDYLSLIQQTRGIESFQVIVNKSNNPPALVNSGILAIGVVIVPILAVREIQLTLFVSKQGLQVSESDVAALS